MDYLAASKALFAGWNNNNIVYCHWKSNEHLLDGLNGDTDLDVLVASEHKEIADKVLENCGYKKYYPQYGSRYPGVCEWIGFDEETGRLIHVHLHYRLITGHKGMKEYEFPWCDETLDTRVLDSVTGVYIMQPELELLTLYSRIGLKVSLRQEKLARKGRYKLSKDDEKEIEYLRNLVNWEKVEALAVKYYGERSVAFVRLLKEVSIDAEGILQLKKLTSTVFSKNRNCSGISATVKQYYYAIALRVVSQLKNKFNFNIITRKVIENKDGCAIAFIGQDGSGKSTVTQEICKWLTWKIEAKRFYLGSGEHYNSWQKRALNILPRKNEIVMPIRALITLSDYVSLARNTYKTLKKSQKYVSKGGIALFDRYPQVEYPGINDGPKIRTNYLPKVKGEVMQKYVEFCAKREEKYLDKAVTINPDIVFKLVLSPEISIQRKPEEDIEAVRKKHEIVKALEFNQAQIHEIDATMNYADELLCIKQAIWKGLV